MNIHSHFLSLQGEGRFQGSPTFFIRLYGCNLDCDYCDARDAVEGESYSEMSVDELVSEVEKVEVRDICITGGEPLCQSAELLKLLKRLKGYRVSIETNGSLDISLISKDNPDVFFSVDWKTPASGSTDFNKNNIEVLRKGKGWVKFVVSDDEDLNFVSQNMKCLEEIEVFISPVFEKGGKFFKKVSDFTLQNKGIKMQLQIHKILDIE